MIAKYGLQTQSRPDRMAGFLACGAGQDGLPFEGQRKSHAVMWFETGKTGRAKAKSPGYLCQEPKGDDSNGN
jgi:hypothetical protein